MIHFVTVTETISSASKSESLALRQEYFMALVESGGWGMMQHFSPRGSAFDLPSF